MSTLFPISSQFHLMTLLYLQNESFTFETYPTKMIFSRLSLTQSLVFPTGNLIETEGTVYSLNLLVC